MHALMAAEILGVFLQISQAPIAIFACEKPQSCAVLTFFVKFGKPEPFAMLAIARSSDVHGHTLLVVGDWAPPTRYKGLF